MKFWSTVFWRDLDFQWWQLRYWIRQRMPVVMMRGTMEELLLQAERGRLRAAAALAGCRSRDRSIKVKQAHIDALLRGETVTVISEGKRTVKALRPIKETP